MIDAPQTRVSVPGKLILMGEHAVVYGRPAIIAGIGLRLSVSFVTPNEAGVHLLLPQIRHDEWTDWNRIYDYSEKARARWETWSEDGESSFSSVIGDDPAHLVKVALGEAIRFFGGETELPPLELILDSDIPIGAGFGSSAAAAVALLSGLLHHAGRRVDFETLDRLGLEVERRQHGMPSGVDHATVLRGGLLWAKKKQGDVLQVEKMFGAGELISKLRVFDTGTPAESTGEVVAHVRAQRERDPEAFETQLARMEFSTRQFRKRISSERNDTTGAIEAIRQYQRLLEAWGVVPEPVREVIRKVEAEGGAAKISGAGSLSGPEAGCLLVLHEEPEQIAAWPFLDPYLAYNVPLACDGLREEPFA